LTSAKAAAGNHLILGAIRRSDSFRETRRITRIATIANFKGKRRSRQMRVASHAKILTLTKASEARVCRHRKQLLPEFGVG
jgi:hypothetical protein